MKRIIYYLSIIFLVFPIMVVVTPILVLGLFCEFVADATDEYLNWASKLADRLF